MSKLKRVEQLVKEYILTKYHVKNIESGTTEHFNYINILQILKGYNRYNNMSWSEIEDSINALIIQAEELLDMEDNFKN